MRKLLPAASAAIMLSQPAMALDWSLSGVHVTVVEATYMPNAVTFQIDGNAGSSCPAGSWLIWPGQGSDASSKQANVEAVYSLLLSAKLTHNSINIFWK